MVFQWSFAQNSVPPQNCNILQKVIRDQKLVNRPKCEAPVLSHSESAALRLDASSGGGRELIL